MKFDTPAGTNPIDRMTIVGQPKDRIDGPLKTTGTATYSHEFQDIGGAPAYGFLVGSAIAKGRITSIDATRAKAAPGVLAVVTHADAGPLGKGKFYVDPLFTGDRIDHYQQTVAIVVAESFEQARFAAGLVYVAYARGKGAFDLVAAGRTAVDPEPGQFGPPARSAYGDFAGAFASAPFKLDATYTTPDQAHAMMEPHASIASWDGDKLTCWCPIQQLNWGVRDLALFLGIPRENIRLVTHFIGGSFGGKGTVLVDTLSACVAARAVGRPVKVALTRPSMFNNTTHRPATIQRIRIAARKDGRITAIGHESLSGNLPGGAKEAATIPVQLLYAGANRMTHLRQAVLDLAEGGAMRAPGEATGMMALEIAMDEMAEKLGIDPAQFRIVNDTQADPQNPAKPFSTRQFVECVRLGGERFGWAKRNAEPGQTRDGDWLVGMGMASAIRGAPVVKSAARVRLDRQGRIVVETDMTDIGTGSYTIIGQTAAEMMGVELDKVVVRLGESDFPESPGSGGQWGAASATSGVYAACVKLREAVAQALGFDSANVEFTDGQVRSGNRSVPLGQAAAAGELVAEDEMTYGDLSEKFEQQSFGAHYVELGVNVFSGEIRLRRMLAVCAAGRILNPKTARSQVIGAMTMGAGAAMMEEMSIDKRFGFFVNHDLAGYEVPVHADIPHQEVIFLDEADATMSPMKAKGVGELGLCGVAAAIANAVYNATGARVREYPITLDKIMSKLPAVA